MQRQTTPAQRFVAEANKQPPPAEACTELGADEPQSPGSWLASVGSALVTVLAVIFAIALICLSPLLPTRQ